MLSSGRVEAHFSIDGDDKSVRALTGARRRLGKFQAELDGVGKSADRMAHQFAEAGDQVATRAGRASTALSSLGDFAGNMEGEFRTASEAAGAIDDVLTLLPGPAGIAAAALAGVGTAAFFMAKQINQTNAAIDQAFGARGRAQIKDFAGAVGVSRSEAVGLRLEIDKLKDDTLKPTTEELRRVREAAEAVGLDGAESVQKYIAALGKGSDALKAFARETRIFRAADLEVDTSALAESLGINQANLQVQEKTRSVQERIRKALDQRAIVGKRINDQFRENGKLSREAARLTGFRRTLALQELRAAERLVEEDRKRRDLLDEQLRKLSVQRDVELSLEAAKKRTAAATAAGQLLAAEAATIGNRQFRIAVQLEAIEEQRVAVAKQLSRVKAVAASDTSKDYSIQVLQLRTQLAQFAAQKQSIRLAETERRRAAAARARARRAAARAKELATDRRSAQLAEQTRQILLNLDRGRLEAAEALARARVAEGQATGASLQEQLAAEQKLADAQLKRAKFELEARGDTMSKAEREIRLQALEVTHRAELARIGERLNEEKRLREQAARESAEMARQAFVEASGAIGAGSDTASQAIGGLTAGVGEAIKQFSSVGQVAPNALSLIGKAGAQFVKSERARAGILAVTSLGDALRAAAVGNLASAGLYGAAAAQYGLVAAGVLGGQSQPTGPATGSTAGAGGGGSAFGDDRLGDDGGARVTNINISGLFATEAQVGKAIATTGKALEGTGLEAVPA